MLLAGSLKLHPYRLQSFCRMPLSTSDTIWTPGSVSKIGQLIGQLAKKLHPYRLHSFCWMWLSTSGTNWMSESISKVDYLFALQKYENYRNQTNSFDYMKISDRIFMRQPLGPEPQIKQQFVCLFGHDKFCCPSCRFRGASYRGILYLQSRLEQRRMSILRSLVFTLLLPPWPRTTDTQWEFFFQISQIFWPIV